MSNWDTKFARRGFTFDDVLLIPAESHVLPHDVESVCTTCGQSKVEYPNHLSGDGYGDRKCHGDCNGASRRFRCYP